MEIVSITIFGILLLAMFYNNWFPELMGWVEDRVRS